jgi:hypothetical protein
VSATFQRLYRDEAGPEYLATPASVGRVLRSMAEAADHPWNSFSVRVRDASGCVTIYRPRRRERAA